MRFDYRLDSAVCLGQNHRESRDQGWSLKIKSKKYNLKTKQKTTFTYQ